MDTKRLHEAIKTLRAELDRVNLAIERIEAIAAALSRELEADSEPSEPEPQITEPAGDSQ